MSWLLQCDRGCCNAQSGDLSTHVFTISRFSFNPVRNISGACIGRNVTSDPIYDKLRHASTRYESTAAAEDAPVEKYEYQAEVILSRALMIACSVIMSYHLLHDTNSKYWLANDHGLYVETG